MKKLITIMLAVVLVLSVSVTAYAATIETENGSESKDVMAKYVENINTVHVCSVDVEWGAMEFTYTASATKTWNPDTHQYVVSDEKAAWSASGNTVTVTNHSDTDVDVTFAFDALDAFDAITGSFDKTGAQTLTSAVNVAYEEAANVTATLTLSGKLADTTKTLTKIGIVTVTLS